MRLTVETERGLLHGLGEPVICSIGRSGACAATDKCEGDGCTPLGLWPVGTVLLRSDRGFVPPAAVPWRWLRLNDGWSDDPKDPAYNRPVSHPWPFSAEHLCREDGLYDAILVLGHNDAPPIPEMGSAIFLHLSGPKPTEGCIAIEPDAMIRLLHVLEPGTVVDVRRQLGEDMPLG